MKKRAAVIVLTAILAASMPAAALGASSPTGKTGGGGGSSRGSSISVGVILVGSGLTIGGGQTTTKADGTSLSTNGAGSITENVKAVFAIGDAATAGLPENAVTSINSINTGVGLTDAVGLADLAGYAALTETSAIILQDATTGEATNEQAIVSIYIPNLIDNLKNIKILCYENATSQWKVIEPIAIDFENKTITFSMSGSGTIAVIYNNN